jgi:hypothetical protein
VLVANPPPLLGPQHRLQHSIVRATGALSGDEPEHVGGLDVCRGLAHDTEEHPEVVRGREHRVRSTPTGQELQIVIDQRHPQPHHSLPGRSPRTDQTTTSRGLQLRRQAATTAHRNVLQDHVHNKQIR